MPSLRNFTRRVRNRVARYFEEIIPGSEIAESIDIDRLICPLRYDLHVRIEFIRLLRDSWPLYTDDLRGFLDRPESRAYYIWFHEVSCARYRPQIYGDERLVMPAFLKRVHETASLWRSIDQNGYDPSTPIRLESARSIRSVNGKTINSTYFAGDGCHRMSCLYVTGQTQLQPEQYKVRVHRDFQPLDNTAILLMHLPLDRTAYLKFISRFYCGGTELDSEEEILRHVASEKASLRAELESVLAVDLPRISPTSEYAVNEVDIH